jgi:drug/metabolite transporter (DMT)-like permease
MGYTAHMWIAVTLLSATLYASLWLFARASNGISSRVVTASQAALGPVALAYGLLYYPMPWHDPIWQRYIAFDCLVIPFVLLLMTYASQRVEVSVIKPLSGLSGLFSLLFAMLLLGERFTAWGVLGVLITTAGLAVLYHGRWSVWKTPYPWMVLAGIILFSIAALLAGMALTVYPHPITVSGLYLSATFAVNALLAGPEWRKTQWTKTTIMLLAAFAVASILQEILTMLAFQMAPVPYVLSVKRTSIILAALAGYVWFNEREQPLWQLMLATGLVVAGVATIGMTR